MQDRSKNIEFALRLAYENAETYGRLRQVVNAIEDYCDSHGATYRLNLRRITPVFSDASLTDCERVEFQTMREYWFAQDL